MRKNYSIKFLLSSRTDIDFSSSIMMLFRCGLTFLFIVILAISLLNIAAAQRRRPGQQEGGAQQGSNCQDFCPFVLRPVCATLTNGKKMEFSNSCQMEVAVCKRTVRKYLKLLFYCFFLLIIMLWFYYSWNSFYPIGTMLSF